MLQNNQITVGDVGDVPCTGSLHRDWMQPLQVVLSVLVQQGCFLPGLEEKTGRVFLAKQDLDF